MDDVKDYIFSWNLRFPYDRLWRKKYNFAFNSSDHRESNFLDQLFDIKEDELFEEMVNREKYEPNTGNWLRKQEVEDKPFEQEIEEFNKQFGE